MNITFSGPQQVMISSGNEGIISENDFKAYFGVIAEAFEIHLEKETIRQGLWKEHPAEDQSNQIKIKIDRVIRSLERLRDLKVGEGQLAEALQQNMLEEYADIINYSVFGSRLVNPADLG
jgi:hypothetical protein